LRGLSIKDWWPLLAEGRSPYRKTLASISLLVIWELWNERNARVFRNKFYPSFVIFENFKREAQLWVLAGAGAAMVLELLERGLGPQQVFPSSDLTSSC
jgi:hypothetical protein